IDLSFPLFITLPPRFNHLAVCIATSLKNCLSSCKCGIRFVHNQGEYLYKCKPTYGNANNFHIFGVVLVIVKPHLIQ
ncbi:unnamed protein product, partial [Rotaria sp. Silwood2]